MKKDKLPPMSPEVETAIRKLEDKQDLTEEEDDLLLTPYETARALTALKGKEVSTRYLPVMVQKGWLTPDKKGSNTSYLYKMRKVRQTTFNRPGPRRRSNQESA